MELEVKARKYTVSKIKKKNPYRVIECIKYSFLFALKLTWPVGIYVKLSNFILNMVGSNLKRDPCYLY